MNWLFFSFSNSYLLELIILLCLQKGKTALMMAVTYSGNNIFQLLIEKGANLDLRNIVRNSVIDYLLFKKNFWS